MRREGRDGCGDSLPLSPLFSGSSVGLVGGAPAQLIVIASPAFDLSLHVFLRVSSACRSAPAH